MVCRKSLCRAQNGSLVLLVVVVVVVLLPMGVETNNTLPSNCAFLKEAPMDRVCVGRYSFELKIRYKDQHVMIGTPFAVWRVSNEKINTLVSFHESELLSCQQFVVTANGDFQCTKPKRKLLSYPNGFMHCFNFYMHYIEEAIILCDATAPKKSLGVKYLSALHYSKRTKFQTGGAVNIEKSFAGWYEAMSTVLVYIIARFLYNF